MVSYKALNTYSEVNPLQPRNAYSPIEVIPAGRVKLVNPLHGRIVLQPTLMIEEISL